MRTSVGRFGTSFDDINFAFVLISQLYSCLAHQMAAALKLLSSHYFVLIVRILLKMRVGAEGQWLRLRNLANSNFVPAVVCCGRNLNTYNQLTN